MSTIRLMPGYDPNWRQRLEGIERRQRELLAPDKRLSDDERDELLRLAVERDLAFNSRFKTTKEYRDFYYARARQLLIDECIDMPLPDVPDDATPDEVDQVLALVWRSVEVTNSENF